MWVKDDTFAALIVYLDYVVESIKSVPVDFANNYDKGVEHYRQCLQDRAQEIALKTEQNISDTVEKLAEKSAGAVSMRTMCLWIAGAVLISALAVCGMGYTLHQRGFAAGFVTGQADQRDEELDILSRSTWAETEDGRAAFTMSKTGQLEMLLNCSGPGWEVQKQQGQRVCLPKPARGGLQGWFLPE
ncbi:MAG: hypothetical protein DELT_02573 [Desulfovibrio sp.]